mgnify:CR=1 FL=1
MDLKKTINELDESQTRVEKHAFDVINSSDTSLNLVKEGITNIKEIVDNMEKRVIAIEKGSIVRDDLKGVYGYES